MAVDVDEAITAKATASQCRNGSLSSGTTGYIDSGSKYDPSMVGRWEHLASSVVMVDECHRWEASRAAANRRRLLLSRWQGWAYEVQVLDRAKRDNQEWVERMQARAMALRPGISNPDGRGVELDEDRRWAKVGYAVRETVLMAADLDPDAVDDQVSELLAKNECDPWLETNEGMLWMIRMALKAFGRNA